MLKIVDFIKKHTEWETILSLPPYSLKIKRKDKRIVFKYDQIKSDPSLEIVKEARGLVLEEGTWRVVAYPFRRFFNYGESYADNINWKSAIAETKEDGSLIKVYFYDNEWKIGTSSTIDAEDAPLNSSIYKTFRELFDYAAKINNLDYSKLNKNYTYIFELCTPFNQIVCPQDKFRIIHIGTRDNRTCKELEVDIGIDKPKRYNLKTLSDCIAMAKTFNFTKEGFVVKDKNYNRIKVKSVEYLRVHRLANNSCTMERAIDIIFSNETSEFLSYFPQYKEYFDCITKKLNFLSERLMTIKIATQFFKNAVHTKAEFATIISKIIENDKTTMYYCFLFYDNKIEDIDEYLYSLDSKKVAKLIKDLIE